jgi:type IV pilus assembly protein PilB
MKPRARLGDLMIESGAISAEQLLSTLDIQKSSKVRKRLGAIVVDSDYATEEELAEAIALQLGLPYIDLRVVSPDPDAVRMMPRALALRYQVLPVKITPTGVMVVMADPTNVVALDDVRVSLDGVSAEIAVSSASSIMDATHRLFGMELAAVELLDPHQDSGSQSAAAEAITRTVTTDTAPVVGLVNSILADAVNCRATDIHVEPQAHSLKVRYRVDGLLREVLNIPSHSQSMVLSRLKILGGMDISERRQPQDGRATITIDGVSIDARMSSIPTYSGEKIVMRLLPTDPHTASLDQLGLSAQQLSTVARHLDRPQGLVIFTGPTGAGKTSTMYSALDYLASPEKNVETLEDPIEYQISGLNQVQIDERAGIDFASGLRSILRQDPDIVMVGEIRDLETAHTVMQAALSGHLVLSSLHTRDAASAVTRLIDLGVEPFLIASALNLVVAQRLIRLNCTHCKSRTTPPASASASLNGALDGIDLSGSMAGKGCGNCGQTGYMGRTGVFEVLPISSLMRSHISSRPEEGDVRAEARAVGVLDLRTQALMLAQAGLTTLEEVLRVTHAEGDDDPLN